MGQERRAEWGHPGETEGREKNGGNETLLPSRLKDAALGDTTVRVKKEKKSSIFLSHTFPIWESVKYFVRRNKAKSISKLLQWYSLISREKER